MVKNVFFSIDSICTFSKYISWFVGGLLSATLEIGLMNLALHKKGLLHILQTFLLSRMSYVEVKAIRYR